MDLQPLYIGEQSTQDLEQEEASEQVWDSIEESLRDTGKYLILAASELNSRSDQIYAIVQLTSYQQQLAQHGFSPIHNILFTLGKILENFDLDEISTCAQRSDVLNTIDHDLYQLLFELRVLKEKRHEGN